MEKIIIIANAEMLANLHKQQLEEMTVALEAGMGRVLPRVYELRCTEHSPEPLYSTYQRKGKGDKKRQRSEWNRSMK